MVCNRKIPGMLPLALKLAHLSPCDPRTLNRAARDYLEKEPRFTLGVAIASLRWLTEGWGYEITGLDVYGAYNYAMKAAEMMGVEEQVRKDIREIVNLNASTDTFVKDVLPAALATADHPVRRQLHRVRPMSGAVPSGSNQYPIPVYTSYLIRKCILSEIKCPQN